MYSVYILYSEKCDRYYIGYCADITLRLQRHNNGTVKALRTADHILLKPLNHLQLNLNPGEKSFGLKNKKAEDTLNG